MATQWAHLRGGVIGVTWRHLRVSLGLLDRQGRLAEALAAHQEALAIRRRQGAGTGTGTGTGGGGRRGTAQTLANIANVLKEQGQVDQAKELYEEALALVRLDRGHDNPDTVRGDSPCYD
jgi:tetratricopeptide (TPR) repeat protein